LLSNTRRFGVIIRDGGLDAVLALPVHPLPVLLVRRVDPIAFGDVIFGVGLFAVTGPDSIEDVAVFFAVTLLGAAVFASFLVIAGCTAFWLKGTEAGDLGFNAMLMLAAYPVDIFAGAPKLLVYTVVPAALVATVPARVVTDADLGDVMLLGIAAVAFVLGAWAVFTTGLRRYTGTSGWTRA
jgi:ABC-2 type transport system permease protein